MQSWYWSFLLAQERKKESNCVNRTLIKNQQSRIKLCTKVKRKQFQYPWPPRSQLWSHTTASYSCMLQLQQFFRRNTKANQSVMILYVNTSGEQSTNKLNSSTNCVWHFTSPSHLQLYGKSVYESHFLMRNQKHRTEQSLHFTQLGTSAQSGQASHVSVTHHRWHILSFFQSR